MIDFSHVWNMMIKTSSRLIEQFSTFGEWATRPLGGEGTSKEILEMLSWALNPSLQKVIDDFFPGIAIDSIWDLSLLDLAIPGCFLVVIWQLVKWLIP